MYNYHLTYKDAHGDIESWCGQADNADHAIEQMIDHESSIAPGGVTDIVIVSPTEKHTWKTYMVGFNDLTDEQMETLDVKFAEFATEIETELNVDVTITTDGGEF